MGKERDVTTRPYEGPAVAGGTAGLMGAFGTAAGLLNDCCSPNNNQSASSDGTETQSIADEETYSGSSDEVEVTIRSSDDDAGSNFQDSPRRRLLARLTEH